MVVYKKTEALFFFKKTSAEIVFILKIFCIGSELGGLGTNGTRFKSQVCHVVAVF